MNDLPLEFLLVCSGTSLQDFELSRLNRMANIRKQLHVIQDELRQVEAEAILARWLIEHREELLAAGRERASQHLFKFAGAPPQPASSSARPERKALGA
jgi:hypothetical protein